MILDHIGLSVSDVAGSTTFFSKALAPLGITLVAEVEGWVGLGRQGRPQFTTAPS